MSENVHDNLHENLPKPKTYLSVSSELHTTAKLSRSQKEKLEGELELDDPPGDVALVILRGNSGGNSGGNSCDSACGICGDN